MSVIPSNFTDWPWRYAETVSETLPPIKYRGEALTLLSNSGNALVILSGSHLTIYRHYHFDGATCAPDFKKGLHGFGVHDALLQLLDEYPGAFPEQQAHDAMRYIHKRDGFAFAWLYHWAVSGWPRRLYKRLSK